MKRCISVLLAILLCLGCLSAFASDSADFTVRVEEKTAKAGELVELNVSLENNSGVLAMLFVLDYDTERLKLTEVKNGGIVAGGVFGNDYTQVPYKMLWNSASDKNFTDDGTLVTLVFEVLGDAQNGMANVTLTYKQKNVYDVDLSPVELTVVNGGVKIGSTSAPSGTGGSSGFGSGSVSRPQYTPTPDKEDDPVVELLEFSDVKADDWFYESVKYVFENKLMNGISETSFAPKSNVTRAMLVTVLYRMENEPTVNKSIPYADVDMSAYYGNAVSWAKQNGIVNGVSENAFAPNANITREQIAAIIYRYAKFKGYDVSVGENTNILSYDDAENISEYAIAAMQYVVGSELIKGKSAATLNPKDNATRAEIAAILQRFIVKNN